MFYIIDMDEKKHQTLRISVTIFLIALVCLAVLRTQYLLALIGAMSSILFLNVVRSSSKLVIDERDQTIREKAAQMTYMIFAPTLGLSALILLLVARGHYFFLESLGVIFAYLTVFLITLYTISSFFIDRKYGGDGQKE